MSWLFMVAMAHAGSCELPVGDLGFKAWITTVDETCAAKAHEVIMDGTKVSNELVWDSLTALVKTGRTDVPGPVIDALFARNGNQSVSSRVPIEQVHVFIESNMAHASPESMSAQGLFGLHLNTDRGEPVVSSWFAEQCKMHAAREAKGPGCGHTTDDHYYLSRVCTK